MDKVRQVRDRVDMPTSAAYFADQTTARNYVRDKQHREMLGEGGAFLFVFLYCFFTTQLKSKDYYVLLQKN